MSLISSIKHHPIISIVVAVDVVLVIVVGILGVMKASKTAIIDVLLAPAKARVEINGKEYGAGAYKINTGKVTAKITADGFKEKYMELELQSDKITKIHEYLDPLEDNLNYYARNDSDLKILERLGNKDMVRVISIKSVLPIIEFSYGGLDGTSSELVITQDFKCNEIFCLIAKGDHSLDHEYVKKIIKRKGYDPDDYSIRYE